MGHSSHSYEQLIVEIDRLHGVVLTLDSEVKRLRSALDDIANIHECELVKDAPELWAAASIERARGALWSGL